MERCPCCNARLGASAVCGRCRADLRQVLDAAQWAAYCLQQAVQYRQDGDLERCLKALLQSLYLKRSRLAEAFLKFIVAGQVQVVTKLLQQRQPLTAKAELYRLRLLTPDNAGLQQLDRFIDYLLVGEAGQNQPVSENLTDPATAAL